MSFLEAHPLAPILLRRDRVSRQLSVVFVVPSAPNFELLTLSHRLIMFTTHASLVSDSAPFLR